MSGKFDGSSGDEYPITLDIEDSLNPPQRLHLEGLIKVVEPKLQISQLTVSPKTIQAGKSAKVTVSFQAPDADPNAKAHVFLWMESSSGSSRGKIHQGDVSAHKGTVSAIHPTNSSFH